MARRRTGNVRHTSDGWSSRVRIAPNDRPTFTLAVRSEGDAHARSLLLADIANRLNGIVPVEEVKALVGIAASAKTDRALRVALEAVDAITSGNTTKTSSALTPTFKDFAEEWTSGRLRERFPDHVRAKDSTRDEELLRLYINDLIGNERIADIGLGHCERVMAAAPATLAPRTRNKIAQCVRKVLSLAVYPGRHIVANPIPREWMPKVPSNATKAKSSLRPTEDATLLGCQTIPVARRLAYGILAREGMRASELERLHWRDVDLQHGQVRLDANKTNDPRAWALAPDVVRTLKWWKDVRAGQPDDLVLGLDLGDGAWWLRGDDDWEPNSKTKKAGDLRTAGIDRSELFERSKNRQPFRLHDLRATFVTISLATGKTEQWVTDRTGHKSSQMLAHYQRQARTWTELGLGTLGALDVLLPEVPRAKHRKGGPSNPPTRRARPTSAHDSHSDRAAIGPRTEPPSRLELETYGLRNRCSTTELRRPNSAAQHTRNDR
jgi:integrase